MVCCSGRCSFSFQSLQSVALSNSKRSDTKFVVAKLKEGGKAPDFAVPDAEGKVVRLKDLRGKKVSCTFIQRRHARLHKRGLLVSRFILKVQKARHRSVRRFVG